MDPSCLEINSNVDEEMIDKHNVEELDESPSSSKPELCENPSIDSNTINDIEDQIPRDAEVTSQKHIERSDSSNNVFVEIPIENKAGESYSSLSDSEDSIIFSNDGDDGFSVNTKPSQGTENPKDLLTEISEILVSLSDDERFVECINFSNNNGFVFENGGEKKRSSVDMIFTYNVLNILFSKLKELKSYYEIVQRDNDKLFKEKNRTEAEHLAYQVQVESLERIVDQQKRELGILQEKFNSVDITWQKEKKDLSDKYEKELNALRKKLETVTSEKDAAVMRYVKNESELISVKQEKEGLLKKFKNLQNEHNDLIKKSKILTNEKNTLGQLLDAKKTELAATCKNMEKYKEELSCKDIKFKWIEENLQKELKQYKGENDILHSKIAELKEQLSKYKSGSISGSRSNNSDEENDTIISSHLENVDNNAENVIEVYKRSPQKEKGTLLIEENNSLSLKVQKLERERLEYERNIMNMKQTCESQNQKITSLQNDLIEMETIRSSLKQLQDKIVSYQNEVDRLKETNEELRQDMESCREREAELLNFTEKLTAKNVSLQSDYAALETKKNTLESERIPMENRISELESKITELSEELKNEMECRNNDNTRLTKLLAEKAQQIESLSAQLEEQQAENQSLKHKYSSTIRELTKEVQQYRKMRQFDSTEGTNSDSVCLESRTSSCNSLNEQVTRIEPDRQALIERIVKLQNINAKQVDKIDFLEEHIAQLLTEVKKKSRVLQHYIIREQSGALSSDMMDQNKAEMTKYGGIMSSIYSNKCDDGTISLELSVEINKKLQAVLEDTLLKNITLKENIETLGKEIDRLTALTKSKES